MPGVKSKFNNSVVGKLTAILGRGKWKRTDLALTAVERAKVESLASVSVCAFLFCPCCVHHALRSVWW